LKLFRFFHPRRPQWAPFYSPGRVAYDKYRERNMEQAQQALTEFYEKECLDPNGTMPWIFVHDCWKMIVLPQVCVEAGCRIETFVLSRTYFWILRLFARLSNGNIPASSTKLDAHPLPKQDDILSALGGSSVFSSLDLVKSFFQQTIAQEYKWKTAIVPQHRGQEQFTWDWSWPRRFSNAEWRRFQNACGNLFWRT